MPHLVEPLRESALEKCITELRQAHECLVSNAKQTVERAARLDASHWGSAFKRLRVSLDTSVECIGQTEANFVEVVNQLAGLERLLDGLEWFCREYPDAHLIACHPSTSSGPEKGRRENDVMLRANDQLFRIEVFDIAGSKMTNGKLDKTLTTFGCQSSWANGRLVIFVSASVGPEIKPRKPGGKGYHFELLADLGETYVFELHPRLALS